MIKFAVFIFAIASVTNARPKEIGSQYVVPLSPICNNGQPRVNGACGDDWMMTQIEEVQLVKAEEDVQNNELPKNMITVPPNCPPGQEYINGACRDVWIDDELPRNMITVPPNCLPGQVLINGVCRDVWRNNVDLPKNMITVPPNCPPGQVLVNGSCRDVWKRSSKEMDTISDDNGIIRDKRQLQYSEETVQVDDPSNRNIINVPNQCPAGYKPDALGVCRQVFP